MARQMVSDVQEVFRIVVTRRTMVDNPAWVRGDFGDDNPRRIPSDERYDATYGPYNSVGVARAQLKYQTMDYRGRLYVNVVAGHIEKATTTWAEVA